LNGAALPIDESVLPDEDGEAEPAGEINTSPTLHLFGDVRLRD